MLLRWLVNNYLREAAEGKVREVVQTTLQRELPGKAPRAEPQLPTPGSGPPVSDPPATEFLPCDIAFSFALGIESGGLVDSLQEAETSRHPHGTERAGKLAGREVVIVESGMGVKAAARATAEAIKFYQPEWIVSAGFAGALDEKL